MVIKNGSWYLIELVEMKIFGCTDLIIFLTLPVTVASAERSFSKLKYKNSKIFFAIQLLKSILIDWLN